MRLPHSPYCPFFPPPPPPPKKKFFITFVFHFFWVLQPSQEKLKTMLMQNLGGGGANKEHYGRSASGVRDFMARNCLANGLRAQAVGYKRIQERLLAYLIYSSKSESRTFRTISFMSTLYHALASFDRSPSRCSHRLVN